jgi:phospholipid transport system substrate-binding protein
MRIEAVARRRLAVPTLALILVVPAITAAPKPPDVVVEEMDRTMLEELRARDAELNRNPASLYALARTKVRPHFDLEHTSKLIVGPAWNRATLSSREAFVAAFERYLISSYARALLFVRKESLSVLGAPQLLEPTHALLPMRVLMDDGEQFETEVHFRLEQGAWRIWDVRASGISFVRQYRGDFGTEARVRGIEACTESLEQIAQRNESELRDRLRETGSIRRAR